MTPELTAAMERLSPTQRQAADWGEGACLVLAGPGVGKTTVLTTRIARILDASRNRNFRILALTFTTKAGDEMRNRVEALVPGLTDRTVIGTFHSFCAQMLAPTRLTSGDQAGFWSVRSGQQTAKSFCEDALRERGQEGRTRVSRRCPLAKNNRPASQQSCQSGQDGQPLQKSRGRRTSSPSLCDL